jgi:hypothetical protein
VPELVALMDDSVSAAVLGVHHSTVAEDIGGNPPQEQSAEAWNQDAPGGNPTLSAVAALAADEKVRAAAQPCPQRPAGQYFPAYASGPSSHSLRSSVGI